MELVERGEIAATVHEPMTHADSWRLVSELAPSRAGRASSTGNKGGKYAVGRSSQLATRQRTWYPRPRLRVFAMSWYQFESKPSSRWRMTTRT